ncbi:hypothetical protein Y032_0625g800 [Ancylostoma ceylanicum]|uniref:Uncharacterized protein n=1 Tax=Ancylostoma ceylanicum TaxID=53326 RepID=A0A016WLN3_9BILA|nr:hypothetical protein Y032_0625g800 [Ancylostoma ceylanicum]
MIVNHRPTRGKAAELPGEPRAIHAGVGPCKENIFNEALENKDDMRRRRKVRDIECISKANKKLPFHPFSSVFRNICRF